MIRMLVADDGPKLLGTVVLHGRLARQIGDRHHPTEAGFAAILLDRHHPVRPVEGAGHDLDPGTIDPAEAERRAAIPAKVALGDRGGTECGRLAAGPGEIAFFDVGEGGKWRAGGFLAHPAMADTHFPGRRGERKANGAALATAGQNGFCSRGHGVSASEKAFCRTPSALAPAKTKSLTPAARRVACCSPARPAR